MRTWAGSKSGERACYSLASLCAEYVVRWRSVAKSFACDPNASKEPRYPRTRHFFDSLTLRIEEYSRLLQSLAPSEFVAFSLKYLSFRLNSLRCLSLLLKFRFRRCSSQNRVPLAAGRLQAQHNPARLWRNWYLRCRDFVWSKRWVISDVPVSLFLFRPRVSSRHRDPHSRPFTVYWVNPA